MTFYQYVLQRVHSLYGKIIGHRPDAQFPDLPWIGWDDTNNVEVYTGCYHCEDAITELVRQGYWIKSANHQIKIMRVFRASYPLPGGKKVR